MRVLEYRSERILEAIVAQYIATGEPVGSRVVSRRESISLSAASVRNVMSDLTEMGYIAQPHVSAGRVPTDRGYRFYVDMLLSRLIYDETEHESIETRIRAAGLDLRDLLRQSSSVLAGLSRQAGVVSSTPPQELTFKTIEFIKVADDRILVVLVATSGFVQNKMILDEDGLDQQTLESYGRMLDDMLKHLDLRQAKERIEQELATEKARFDAMLANALRMGHTILSQDDSREIFIEGQTNILNEPEFAEVEKLKAVLLTFEEKSKLLKILDKTLDAEGIQVFIGAEHGLNEIESCSIIAYPIRAADVAWASIGVIGPKRMDYHKVVPLVDTTARILTQLLKKYVENDA
ncbi:MAG: heat-inducible transcriptional repressor HrcA [Desulfomonilaceae bacterium]|nr:heat-inducible transcriptional repressor HrcA [Desulfomonilaceae bacterium]